MDALYGFLVGLAYSPAIVLVVGVLVLLHASFRSVAAITLTTILAGPAVLIFVFIFWGIAAGFASFGGWILGMGLAGVLALGLIIGRLRARGSRNSADSMEMGGN